MTRLIDEQAIDEFKAVELPSPARTRWQPIRGGLLNLYLYDCEEFRYENGHLLLRGNNGTGKSRIMALQLPFLFDGQLASYRVEPDADSSKKMEWNLLMGKHNERTGYTWIEFGKVLDGATNVSPTNGYPASGHSQTNGDVAGADTMFNDECYLTLGCGLSATKGSGMRKPWFFVTNQRVGRDLFLQSETGHPIGKSALTNAIGEHGEVFDTAQDYRAEVDERLFGLGRRRYEAMVDLLIQLRKPQLSRDLDEKMLARVLGEALPPPSESMIKDVAESFKGLESERMQLDRFRMTRDGVDQFLKVYRRYAQVASRRRAEVVRARHSQYEKAQSKLKEARSEFAEAETKLESVNQQVADLQIKREKLNAKLTALESDPAMKGAHAIKDAQKKLDIATTEFDATTSDLDAAKSKLEKCSREMESTRSNLEVQLKKTKGLAAAAKKAAGECDLDTPHQKSFDRINLTEITESNPEFDLDTLKATLDKEIQQKHRAIQTVASHNGKLDTANSDLQDKRAQLDAAKQNTEAAIENEKHLEKEREKSLDDFLDAISMWSKESNLLESTVLESVDGLLDQWSHEIGEKPNPIVDIIARANFERQKQWMGEVNELESKRTLFRDELVELEKQRRELENGAQLEPQLPFAFSEQNRRQTLGAPLWTLLDFEPTFPAKHRANIEAALQSAGLLNAWVTDDGELLNFDTHEVVFDILNAEDAPDGRQLNRVLRLAEEANNLGRLNLKPETIETILRKIGVGDNAVGTWVTQSGRWKNGLLEGRWSKQFAEYIGTDAQEAFRSRTIKRLAAEIKQNNEEVLKLDEALVGVKNRMAELESHVALQPSDTKIREIATTLKLASTETVVRRNKQLEQEEQFNKQRTNVESVKNQRDTIAQDLGLTHWVDDLGDLGANVSKYELKLSGFWPTCDHFRHVRQSFIDTRSRLSITEQDQATLKQRLHKRETACAAAAQLMNTLKESVGKDADKILVEIESAKSSLSSVANDLEQAETDSREADKKVTRLDERIKSAEAIVNEETTERLDACESFKRLVALGILKTASRKFDDTESESWSTSKAVDIARKTEAKFSNRKSDPAAWDRVRQNVTESNQELATALSQQSFVPTLTTHDSLYIVTVPYEGRDRSVAELYDFLDHEVEQRRLILNENERKIIETHLIGEVASKLNEQIQEANVLVDRMNTEIQQRPMSTGMTLRFDWRADKELSGGIVEVCERLLGKTDGWSTAERESIGRFLQAHIQEVRTAREKGTWLEHLREALDYRQWHRFWVERKQDGGGWKKLTKKTHGTGSGGEKAVALTIPQFAAASAHYSSAREDAPRLILLDEAFVGIDPDMRAKCMELIDVFDLDFLMTSESEWGCYSTLPGVGIYQLSTRRGFDAVFLTRWIWNGKRKLPDKRELPPASLPKKPR